MKARNLNLRQVELFVAVAQRLSFAAVAKDLGLDPSSVSRAIAELEADLGLRLFQRTTRAMRLTEAGVIYLEKVAPLLDEMAGARDLAAQVSSTPTGTIRLTASVTFGQTCLVPILPAFRSAYPSLALECLFTDAVLDLVADRIDLAVRLAPAITGDVVAAKLRDTRYKVVASPLYLANHPPLLEPADLFEHRVIRFTLPAFRSAWIFRSPSRPDQTIHVDGDLSLAPAGAILEAAIAGLGPALLPDWLVNPAIAQGTLTHVLASYAVTATSFDTAAWLVYPHRSYLPRKVRVMTEFLRQHLSRPG
ncbi:MAG: LysR family transcriptional regulator [Alphaproteobacteria bacterium]|nr:LysR family transcriptional regulator [Alphaproteobacteria bacterium]